MTIKTTYLRQIFNSVKLLWQKIVSAIKKYLKQTLRLTLWFAIFNFLLILLSYFIVETFAQKQVYDSIQEIPENRVGLILGTSKYIASGQLNLYFKYRIEAAVNLYKAGKIKFIVVSGDNQTIWYNEPKQMKEELIKYGIPNEVIYLDYAGFRTLDSVVRCKEIFGQNKFTIISQEFHNKRALYIAGYSNIDAVAYNAQDVESSYDIKTKLRELLARVKVIIDLHIINKQPKFLGDTIRIQ